MSDIVERLRAPAYWISGSSEGHEGDNNAPLEAADEIERLNRELDHVWDALAIQREDNGSFGDAFKRMTSEIERLRAALDLIAKGKGDPVTVAVAALAEEKQG